jgi:nicotinamide-nucleotide adenylyltransferase
MPAETIGLYIGKFQPFHNGHLFAVRTIAPEVSKLIIAIGSSQYHGLKNQPFSAGQRRQMIEQSLAAIGIDNVSIVEVPDIHNNERWVEHVRDHVKQFDIVFTNNKSVRQLFIDKGFKVKPIKVLPCVSGSLIRHKITNQDNSWTTLVPVTTANIIKQALYTFTSQDTLEDTGLAT